MTDSQFPHPQFPDPLFPDSPEAPPGGWPLDHLLARLADLPPLPETRRLPLAEAAGQVLADPLIAPTNQPRFDNSAMDGFAARAADAPTGPLPVVRRILAGQPAGAPLEAGTAVRIMTGAPLPAGADAVAMQEHCRLDGAHVHLPPTLKAGANIRRAGEEFTAGQTALPAGVRLGPAQIGLAAALGVGQLTVRRPVRVAVFATGDELVEPGQPCPEGAIPESNRLTLATLLTGLGCTVKDLGILPDHRETITAALAEAAPEVDLIVTSGGVSVGEADHVRQALTGIGRLGLWKLAIKPGKPLALGRIGHTLFLGLPGNPVSVMVTALMIGRPLVLALQGRQPLEPRRLTLPAAAPIAAKAGRRTFLRARLDNQNRVHALTNQGSAMLSGLAMADGLIDLPADSPPINTTTPLTFLPLPDLLT